MVEKTTTAGRSSWWLLLYPAIVGLGLFIAHAICQADDFLFLNIFLIGPTLLFVGIALLIYAAVRNRPLFLPIVATQAMVWAVAVALFLYHAKHPFELHDTARWFVWSREYKEKVLAEPSSANGNLKHIEWDGSGFAGVANNTVYLVFDPADTLSEAARSHQPSKCKGIPCPPRVVRRLESHWYAVLFYTDQDWDHCN